MYPFARVPTDIPLPLVLNIVHRYISLVANLANSALLAGFAGFKSSEVFLATTTNSS